MMNIYNALKLFNLLKLELTHKIHTDFEEEFNRRNWNACQVVNQHRDLMDCLNEENEAKNHLSLELHKARGRECPCFVLRRRGV